MERNLNKVAVIGAGVMGAGIASQIASAGIETILFDIVPFKLTPEQEAKGLTLDSKEVRYSIVQNGYNIATDKKRGLVYNKDAAKRITIANLDDDLDKLSECDWIIEVVIERLDIKHSLFQKIAPYIKEDAIVSTNTSGISINKIAEGLPKEKRANFLGTHFFNPVRYMHLLELIQTEDTNPEILDYLAHVGSKYLGKGVVICRDTPNFIGNRIGVFAQCATLQAYERYNFNFAEIDQITGPILARPKSATFRTADIVGLDIIPHVTQTCLTEIDPTTEDLSVYNLPKFYTDMIENGQLGNKARAGFYRKNFVDGKKVFEMWDPKSNSYVVSPRDILPEVKEAMKSKQLKDQVNSIIYGEGEANKFAWEILRDTLLYSAHNVPTITDDYKDIDRAMKWGYNWSAGPFEIWDMLGFNKVIEKMQGDGKVVPNWVLDIAKNPNPSFYTEAEHAPYLDAKYPLIDVIEGRVAALDMGDGVVLIELRSPGNSADRQILQFMQKTIKMVEDNPKYKGVVIGNDGANYCAGVNLPDVISTFGNEEAINNFIREFQAASRSIKFAKKPVVSAIKGMVLGGGVELTIHSHRVVALAESYVGFVEVGVGIIPAARGCVEMLTRVMEDHKKYGYPDALPAIRKVWEQLAMAKVSKDAYQAREFGYLTDKDRIVLNPDILLDEAKKELLRMVDDGFEQEVPKAIKVLGETGYASLEYIAYTMYQGNFISEHDLVIARQVARVLTGGSVPNGTVLNEQQLMDLERNAGATLLGEEKSRARMVHMAEKNKPLRN
ncbi:3-hydroxyacyl-CoA dehydrogenase/enoyl-CoA hydratase family protein [Mollicutes bacterium LVI A0039]|nr:3-hydroxyacyl-CoA dehydrogenase/enoyl-CoA hydratase family protein [Mollicutes bacterium LVI A0039]